jgi:hypothetical protein
MKQGCLLLLFTLFLTASVSADIIESFDVGEPFESGVSGPIVGAQISVANFFDTAPFQTGNVNSTNARSILAGGGDVLFTSLADGTSTLEFDMGVGLQLTTLDAALSYSEIQMQGIQADGDADNFKFEFRTVLLDGTTVLDLNDISITATTGTINFTNLDVGLYEAEVSGIVGSTDIVFTGANGNFVRAVNFRSITPDFESNELRVLGSRTLTSVPEPGSMLFLGLPGTIALLRRRKSRNA